MLDFVLLCRVVRCGIGLQFTEWMVPQVGLYADAAEAHGRPTYLADKAENVGLTRQSSDHILMAVFAFIHELLLDHLHANSALGGGVSAYIEVCDGNSNKLTLSNCIVLERLP